MAFNGPLNAFELHFPAAVVCHFNGQILWISYNFSMESFKRYVTQLRGGKLAKTMGKKCDIGKRGSKLKSDVTP